MDICREVPPALTTLTPNHKVACYACKPARESDTKEGTGAKDGHPAKHSEAVFNERATC